MKDEILQNENTKKDELFPYGKFFRFLNCPQIMRFSDPEYLEHEKDFLREFGLYESFSNPEIICTGVDVGEENYPTFPVIFKDKESLNYYIGYEGHGYCDISIVFLTKDLLAFLGMNAPFEQTFNPDDEWPYDGCDKEYHEPPTEPEIVETVFPRRDLMFEFLQQFKNCLFCLESEWDPEERQEYFEHSGLNEYLDEKIKETTHSSRFLPSLEKANSEQSEYIYYLIEFGSSACFAIIRSDELTTEDIHELLKFNLIANKEAVPQEIWDQVSK